MNLSEDEAALKRALVGSDPERVRLYRHSAIFKSSIDTLAKMLPLWVDGLATNADANEARLQQHLTHLRGPLFPGDPAGERP